MTRCTHADCFAPEVMCHLGEENRADCSFWKEALDAAAGSDGAPAADTTTGATVPWSGNALGLVDLPFTSGRGAPRVVAVVGAAGAGKTTLLGSWYLMLSRGALDVASHAFAGSYTLSGWENIAHSLRWANDGGPGFPAHTPSGEGRAPGMVHLALRRGDHAIEDVLFADAPGEWFRAWSVNRDAPEAEGARWLATHGSVIILTADCEALAGPEKGNARMTLQALAQRIATERRGRPVALVWTKADIDVAENVRDSVMTAVTTHLGDVQVFEVSVKEHNAVAPEASFVRLMNWVLGATSTTPQPMPARTATDDPFLAYGYV
jgi:ABC-type cobalamin/Fe3+-siderophores transport system ATPase subunit